MEKWKNEVATITTYWKSITWKEHNTILRKSTVGDQLDILLFRDIKLKIALKRIKENDEFISVTDEIIDNLDANVAEALLSLYDKLTEPSLEDLEDLRNSAYAYFTGKRVNPQFVQYFHEHQIAKHYNWELNDIRSMDYCDFQAHLQICMGREKADNEFAAALAGAKSGGGGSSSSTKRFDPNTGTFI